MKAQQSSLPWYRWLNSDRVIRLLETVQDFIVICLCIGLFSFMVLQLREMVLSLLPPLEFQPVTSDILFLLILVELFRLLIIYLQEHRVSIGVAVEVSIVSVLREIIVRGVLETPWVQVLVACVFLLVLGALLVVRVWLPPTFEGIDPEQLISERHRSRTSERDRFSHQTVPATPNEQQSILAMGTPELEAASKRVSQGATLPTGLAEAIPNCLENRIEKDSTRSGNGAGCNLTSHVV